MPGLQGHSFVVCRGVKQNTVPWIVAPTPLWLCRFPFFPKQFGPFSLLLLLPLHFPEYALFSELIVLVCKHVAAEDTFFGPVLVFLGRRGSIDYVVGNTKWPSALMKVIAHTADEKKKRDARLPWRWWWWLMTFVTPQGGLDYAKVQQKSAITYK